MNLHQYLVAIEANKAINLKRFIALMPLQHQQSWRNIFSHQKESTKNKDTYKLTVLDNDLFQALLQASKPNVNRIDAAISGDSHNQNTSMSFLLVFNNVYIEPLINTHEEKNTKSPRLIPNVVVCNDSTVNKNFECQSTLVIIENQENFFRYQEFLPKLVNSNSAVDIAFGQGNSVTNKLNSAFFGKYKKILCCFDYDFGGLTMYSSLLNLMGNTSNENQEISASLSFVLPPKTFLRDESFLKSHFKKVPKDSKQWQNTISLAEQLYLNDLAYAFTHSKKFMEQEIYLADHLLCLKE